MVDIAIDVLYLNLIGSSGTWKDVLLTHVAIHFGILPVSINVFWYLRDSVINASYYDSRPVLLSILRPVEFKIKLRSLNPIPADLSIVPFVWNINGLSIQLETCERLSLQVSVEGVISTPSVSILAAICDDVFLSCTSEFVIYPLATLTKVFSYFSRIYTRAELAKSNLNESTTVVSIVEETDLWLILNWPLEISIIVIWGILYV